MTPAIQEAVLKMENGSIEEGRDALQSALSADPASFDALFWLATAERRLGNMEAAVCFGERALRLRPGDFHALMNLAFTFLEVGKAPRAVQVFRAASQLDPQSLDAVYFLGLAERGAGNLVEAERAFREASKLAPHHFDCWMSIADIRRRSGDPGGAALAAREAVSINPNSRAANLLFAEALLDDQRFGDAIAVLSPIAGEPRSRALLGKALQSLGRIDEARAAFRDAINLDARSGFAYYSYSQLAPLEQQTDQFVAELRSRLEDESSDETNAYLHFALGISRERRGEFKDAMAQYDAGNRLARQIYHPRTFDRKSYAANVDRIVSEKRPTAVAPNDDETALLIVGMMRSGTTLTEQILSSHSAVAAGGEGRFWQNRQVAILTNPASIGASAKEYADSLKRLSPGARFVTDKMPGNYSMLGIIHEVLPKARIVHVRRNPADTCFSIYALGMAFRVPFAHDRSNIAFAYKQYLRLMERWRRVLPAKQFLEIDYEDLVLDRETVTRRLIDFCGLDWEEACLHPERNMRAVATPSAVHVRQPVYTSSIGRWRNFEPWVPEFKELVS